MFLCSAVNLNRLQFAINPVGNVRGDFSIIIFIIVGENMAEHRTEGALMRKAASSVSKNGQIPLWKSADWHDWIWTPTTGNQVLDTNKTSSGLDTSGLTCKFLFIFFSGSFLLAGMPDWHSQTEIVNLWDQNGSSRINTQRPDPHSTITLSPTCQWICKLSFKSNFSAVWNPWP